MVIFSTTYGVTTDSILNRLKHYHITSGLPPDVMHDILEGVVVVELKCMLIKFSQHYNLSLAFLNEQIDHFPYGFPDTKSKPLKLPTSYSSTDHESHTLYAIFCEIACKHVCDLFSLSNMVFD